MSQHRIFPNSAVFYSFIYHESSKFLQADCRLSLHATFSFSVGDVIWDKVTWIRGNLTAIYYKTANCGVISNDWSHLGTQPVVDTCYVRAWYLSVPFSWLPVALQWLLLRKIIRENCRALYWLQLRGIFKQFHRALFYLSLWLVRRNIYIFLR